MHHGTIAGEHGRPDDVVVPVHGHRAGFLVDENFQKREEVLGVKARRGCCQPARVAVADDLDAVCLDEFARLGARHIAATLDGEVDDH
jgi:hypothetical protein